MAIKSIRVSNFKSFKDAYIELSNFNILIGANASGKSNFLQILKFLRDIVNHGLKNAISLQGGIEYLRNTNIGASQNLDFEIVLDNQYGKTIERENMCQRLLVNESIYKFSIKFNKQRGKRGLKFTIVEDSLKQKCVFYNVEDKNDKILRDQDIISEAEIVASRNSKKNFDIKLKFYDGDTTLIKNSDLPFFLQEDINPNTDILLLETKLFSFLMSPIDIFFHNITIYDFDPKLPKKATPITGKAELEEDGSNLAIVINNIINDSENKRKFSNLLREILIFVNDLDVENFADKSLIFKLKEIYSQTGNYIPSSLISDGTVNVIELIIALYFEDKPLVVIEEPERNIHPHLISKIVEMMTETSQQKQIITTTHNPEIIKNADLNNIILISRDKEGFSKISRPVEREEVKVFLENHIGIDELYVQNLLNL